MKMKVQLWKWTMRPNKDKSEFAHKADIIHKRAGKIGHDTHYFTIVNYCPDRYYVFDTIDNAGRDVSADFEDRWRSGNAKGRDLLKKDFTFKFDDDFADHTPPVEHPYEKCIIECKSDWLKPKDLKANRVPRCLTGITL